MMIRVEYCGTHLDWFSFAFCFHLPLQFDLVIVDPFLHKFFGRWIDSNIMACCIILGIIISLLKFLVTPLSSFWSNFSFYVEGKDRSWFFILGSVFD